MFLFKTKKRTAFTTLTASLTAYGTYDKYEYNQIKSKYLEQASKIGSQPMDIHESPRKVIVYTAPSQYSEYCFKQYVKPIFDAAALDYEIVVPRQIEQVREKVRDYLWVGKEEALKRQPLPEDLVLLSKRQAHQQKCKTLEKVTKDHHRHNHTTTDSSFEQENLNQMIEKEENKESAKKRTWSEFLFGKNLKFKKKQNSPLNEQDRIQAFLNAPKYNPSHALIAFGPESFEAMISGIHDGCYAERPSLEQKQEKQQEEGEKDEKIISDNVNDTTTNTSSKGDNDVDDKEENDDDDEGKIKPIVNLTYSPDNLPLQSPHGTPMLEYNTLDLPVLGYIPAKNLVGWRKFPSRIYAWFHERDVLKDIGERALNVVFEHCGELYEHDPLSIVCDSDSGNNHDNDNVQDGLKDRDDLPLELKSKFKIYIEKL